MTDTGEMTKLNTLAESNWWLHKKEEIVATWSYGRLRRVPERKLEEAHDDKILNLLSY